jgi:hypothetical protein
LLCHCRMPHYASAFLNQLGMHQENPASVSTRIHLLQAAATGNSPPGFCRLTGVWLRARFSGCRSA